MRVNVKFPSVSRCLCTATSFQEADNDPTGEAAANTQQTLTFYELDLGLNHVVRKYSEALEEHGNFLITGMSLTMIGSRCEISSEVSVIHVILGGNFLLFY